MTKVITYGTYDLLHYGHIRLLERAKALGDYLIVGVTTDDFDKSRGKINVKQSFMERMEAVRATGLADEIIAEEYEGQKIDDLQRYDVDIFTVGSDWVGKFDYLNEYCKVVYLERTEGVSSSQIRAEKTPLRLGLVGNPVLLDKYCHESMSVNGMQVVATYNNTPLSSSLQDSTIPQLDSYEDLLERTDAVYIASHVDMHLKQIETALLHNKHVLCEAPIALNHADCRYLFDLATKNHLVLMEAIKTAYSTAYNRLLLLVKSGRIGEIVSVDATCTSLMDLSDMTADTISATQNSLCAWGPTALLPIFQILGNDYNAAYFTSHFADTDKTFDLFTKIDFYYPNAVASIKVGKGVKSEGQLIVTGTKGYIYVPAPWWKTDYFEIRYENPADNQRYFYQLDGEGIRYELVAFLRSIEKQKNTSYISQKTSEAISKVIEKYYTKDSMHEIQIKY